MSPASAAWLRTPRAERWTNHVSTALVSLTGAALVAFDYLIEAPQADPFSVVSHPWRPQAQALHVLAAPLGVLAVGLLLRHHVVARLAQAGFRRSRRSGWLLALTAFPMIFSGYLLQVAVDETWRRAWLVVHLVTGGLWALGWLLHLASARGWLVRGGRSPASAAETPEPSTAQ